MEKLLNIFLKIITKKQDNKVRDTALIAIDPGQKGGIVICSKNKVCSYKMPPTYSAIYDLLRAITFAHNNCVAVVEDVGYAFKGNTRTSIATFARHNGHIEMALYALGIPITKVIPRKWENYYSDSIGTKQGQVHEEWKRILKNEAMKLFPNNKVTLYTADAFLIAHYAQNNL